MRLGISLPENLVACLDADRGDVSRSLYIRRLIERRMASAPPVGPRNEPDSSVLRFAREAEEFYDGSSGVDRGRAETFRRITQGRGAARGDTE